MSNIPTPHIAAKAGDFAETVLMPGDPLRAKFIAETFLENPVLVNNVRGVQGYTGDYRGKRVLSWLRAWAFRRLAFTLMSSIFMMSKISSASVPAGVIRPDQGQRYRHRTGRLHQLQLAAQFDLPGTFAPICSYTLLQKAVSAAKAWA